MQQKLMNKNAEIPPILLKICRFSKNNLDSPAAHRIIPHQRVIVGQVQCGKCN